MTTHSLIVLRPRERSFTGKLALSLREVMSEIMAFERTHARVAWGMTLVGLAIGLALQAVG